jgi:hypothetical protein
MAFTLALGMHNNKIAAGYVPNKQGMQVIQHTYKYREEHTIVLVYTPTQQDFPDLIYFKSILDFIACMS